MRYLTSLIRGTARSFAEHTAIWVGVFSIMFGILGTVYSIRTYYDSAHTNEIFNRPYLELGPPQFVFLDENGREFAEGTFPEFGEVEFFKLVAKHTNAGQLPAERLSLISTTSPEVLIAEKSESVVIYDEDKTVSDVMPIQQLEHIFKEKAEFKVRTEAKYRAVGSEKIYTAFIESRCSANLTNTAFKVSCVFDRKGTD